MFHLYSYFNVGYAIFLIPSQIIITRVRPSLWLPALEACWGVLTIATYKVTNYKQVYVFIVSFIFFFSYFLLFFFLLFILQNTVYDVPCTIVVWRDVYVAES